MKYFLSILIGASLLFYGCGNKKNKEKTISETTVQSATSSQLNIISLQHATMVLEWEDTTIYVDPVGGTEAFDNQKPPDLILITDIHGDHLNVETLEALNTEKAKIVVPQAVANQLPAKFDAQVDVLNNGESKERYGIVVEAIPMYNLREEALDFHKKGRGNGYVLNLGDERVYISGDTEDIPEMRNLVNIDKAFVCMNLPYTMTIESAADAVLEFKPKQVYPYHYRGTEGLSDVSKFKTLVNDVNASIEVVQLDWYADKGE
ncbi:MAG: MBL fold metallo-hydrolase [Croceitalea sp.]|nr:MBL fold metallo-hydrolase [Croceitalea sp.]